MAEANKYHIITLILGLFITTPIWFYLLYKILEYINATQLMWFLFYVYIPVQIVIQIIGKVADMQED